MARVSRAWHARPAHATPGMSKPCDMQRTLAAPCMYAPPYKHAHLRAEVTSSMVPVPALTAASALFSWSLISSLSATMSLGARCKRNRGRRGEKEGA